VFLFSVFPLNARVFKPLLINAAFSGRSVSAAVAILDLAYRSTLGRVVAYIRRKIEQRRIKKAVEYWERLFEEVLGYPDQDP